MEYLFGTLKINGEFCHTMRIKTDKGEKQLEYTPGSYYTHIQSYPDVTLTDSFKVEKQIQESTDSEGNRYVWYELSEYNRNIDRSHAVAMQASQDNDATNARLDYVAMMADVDIPDFSDIGGEM